MRTEIFRRHLGDLSTDSILANMSTRMTPMDAEFLKGQTSVFSVHEEFEMSILDGTEFPTFAQGKLPALPEKKLVRLVLEPLSE